jgi:hypothetical protein
VAIKVERIAETFMSGGGRTRWKVEGGESGWSGGVRRREVVKDNERKKGRRSAKVFKHAVSV